MVKNPPANAGDIKGPDSFPESGRPPKEGHNNPLQYSCLENPMDKESDMTEVTQHSCIEQTEKQQGFTV